VAGGAVQVDAALLATAAWSLAIFGATAHPLHGELMRRLRGMHPADFDALALNSLFQARRLPRRQGKVRLWQGFKGTMISREQRAGQCCRNGRCE
jgi:hypothetical protein